MTVNISDPPRPASFAEALARFAGALINQRTRAELQLVGDEYLRPIIAAQDPEAVPPQAEIIGVLINNTDALGVFLKHPRAVAPLRAAGFTLTPFSLQHGRPVEATDADAIGWQISEPGDTAT